MKKEESYYRIKKNGDHYDLIQSAKDVLKKSPRWIPATSNGTQVEMRFRLPIRFYTY